MSFLTKLPFELHIPGYQYCGPSTKLKERLARGDPGRNPLDKLCKDHDIAYSQSTSTSDRHNADRILADKAWERAKAKDASVGEKIAAWGVTNAMKTKVKLGFGIKKRVKKSIQFSKVVSAARRSMGKDGDIRKALNSARFVKKGHVVRVPAVIPLKKGGFLPLIPLFAALSAVGSLMGGAAGVATAVNKAKAAEKQLEEQKRHNEAVEPKKIGNGLYLRPYKGGFGLYLPKN